MDSFYIRLSEFINNINRTVCQRVQSISRVTRPLDPGIMVLIAGYTDTLCPLAELSRHHRVHTIQKILRIGL